MRALKTALGDVKVPWVKVSCAYGLKFERNSRWPFTALRVADLHLKRTKAS
jgi:hypothetical protein